MKLLLVLMLLSLPLVSYADKIEIDRNKLIEQGNKMIDIDIAPEITPELRKQVEESIKLIKNQVIPKSKKIAETITFDNDTGIMSFNRLVNSEVRDKNNDLKNSLLAADERIYVFISSSIPKDVIIRYAQDIEALGLGRNVVFILRGCIDSGKGIGGCGDYSPTINFIKSFAYSKKNSIRNVQIWIDPSLFKKYHINAVPAFVYNESVKLKGDIGSEGNDEQILTSSNYYSSIGDWSFLYHLRELEKKSNSSSLKKILEGYKDEE